MDKNETNKPKHNEQVLNLLISQNFKLKMQLHTLCKEIEDNLKMQKSVSGNPKSTQPTESFLALHGQINNNKNAIQELKAKMEGFFNLGRIEAIEEEIKNKTENLSSSKNENFVLMSIKKNHSRARNDHENKYENKKEIKTLTEKIQTVKDELNYSKENLKTSETNLKLQNRKIIDLEETNLKIKQSIEYKKKITSEYGDSEESMYHLGEKLKLLENQIQNEEKYYKEAIKRQHSTTFKLNEESTVLKIQIKEKEQNIKINAMKIREINKINRQLNNRSETSITNTTMPSKKRLLSEDTKASNKSANELFAKSILRKNKPFEIKFNKLSIESKTEDVTPSKRNEEEMISQIKLLKNEIELALRHNKNSIKYLNNSQEEIEEISEIKETINSPLIIQNHSSRRKPFNIVFDNN